MKAAIKSIDGEVPSTDEKPSNDNSKSYKLNIRIIKLITYIFCLFK